MSDKFEQPCGWASVCCGAPVRVNNPNAKRGQTVYHICTTCDKPCNSYDKFAKLKKENIALKDTQCISEFICMMSDACVVERCGKAEKKLDKLIDYIVSKEKYMYDMAGTADKDSRTRFFYTVRGNICTDILDYVNNEVIEE